jgi:iron complex outermembrane recepter protein
MTPYPAFTVSRRSRSDAWSQELRLQQTGERFDWMIGAIYSRDEITETDLSTHLATDPYLRGWGALLFALGAQSGQINPAQQPFLSLLTGGQVPTVFGPQTVGNFEDVDRDTETRSAAAFADFTWHATARLDVSAGLRYTDDTVTVGEVTRRTITIPTGTDRDEGGFDDVSPRVAVSFRPRDGMQLYASAAKGYKVGGFNSTATTVLPAIQKRFGEETAWNYEVGYKALFAGDRVQLTAAAFWFDWKDLQVRGQDVLTQRQFVQNAADAESKGGELELVARATEWLTLRASYGRVDAEFGRFPNAVNTAGAVFNATGNRIPYSPENTYSASVDVDAPLGAYRGYFRADWTYVDDQFFDAENSQARLIPAYDVLDLRVGVTRGAWDFALFLKNALDEEYVLGNQNLETFLSGDQVAIGQPRTFGGTVRFRF